MLGAGGVVGVCPDFRGVSEEPCVLPPELLVGLRLSQSGPTQTKVPYSRLSLRPIVGTKSDARYWGQRIAPLQRKRMFAPSAASKDWAWLEYRPVSDLKRMSAGLDLELDGLVPVDRSGWTAVENDLKRFAAKLHGAGGLSFQHDGG